MAHYNIVLLTYLLTYLLYVCFAAAWHNKKLCCGWNAARTLVHVVFPTLRKASRDLLAGFSDLQLFTLTYTGWPKINCTFPSSWMRMSNQYARIESRDCELLAQNRALSNWRINSCDKIFAGIMTHVQVSPASFWRVYHRPQAEHHANVLWANGIKLQLLPVRIFCTRLGQRKIHKSLSEMRG